MGACIGSFISMATYRIPLMLAAKERGDAAGLSLSYPPSSCPCCKNTLKPWSNLPLLGYLLSAGKCSHCKVKIPLRYLALEVAAALWALAATYLWSEPLPIAAWTIFGWYLLAMAWMDAESQWLPDCLTLPLLGLGLIFSSQPESLVGPANAWLSALGAFVILEALNVLNRVIKGVDGLGGGDAKLLSAFGAWFGALHTLYIATAAFAIFILYYSLTKSRGRTAFGPMLCMSGILTVLVQAIRV